MVKVSEHVWLGQQLYQLGWMSPLKKTIQRLLHVESSFFKPF